MRTTYTTAHDLKTTKQYCEQKLHVLNVEIQSEYSVYMKVSPAGEKTK